VPQTSDINGAIDGFLRLRETQGSRPPTTVGTSSSVRARRRPSVEKSIVS
jgi:hypothetical protein